MRAFSSRRAFALCASLLSLGLLPATAAATSSQSQIDTAIDKAIAYTLPQQEAATGAIEGFGGDWMATALAAAGLDLAGVRGPNPGDPSLQDFVLGAYTLPTWDDDPPGGTAAEYARSTLISHAAGLDPARLSATSNQPAQLAGRWNAATGSYGEANSNTTAFAIFAMKTAGLPRWALAPTVAFLRRNQHDDGGWTHLAALTGAAREEASEEDMTGAAVAALCEAGFPAYDPDVAEALAFLRGRLVNATGGVEYLWGPPNSSVNAWVVSGLNACGIDPQSAAWTTGAGKTPIDFLLSLQVPAGPGAGGFGYATPTGAEIFSTQDVLRAIAGGVFTAEPRSLRSPPAVAAGTPVPHVLAIEVAPDNVRICKVTAPAGAALTAVLATAQSSSRPTGCVTSFSVAGGEVKSVSGVSPESGDEAWLLRLDHGNTAVAGGQPVGFGEVISLRIGPRPVSAAGTQNPVGTPGPVGPRGPAGKKGHRTCRSGKARAAHKHGKHRGHCKAKRRVKRAAR
jgi:hypothetical protein